MARLSARGPGGGGCVFAVFKEKKVACAAPRFPLLCEAMTSYVAFRCAVGDETLSSTRAAATGRLCDGLDVHVYCRSLFRTRLVSDRFSQTHESETEVPCLISHITLPPSAGTVHNMRNDLCRLTVHYQGTKLTNVSVSAFCSLGELGNEKCVWTPRHFLVLAQMRLNGRKENKIAGPS